MAEPKFPRPRLFRLLEEVSEKAESRFAPVMAAVAKPALTVKARTKALVAKASGKAAVSEAPIVKSTVSKAAMTEKIAAAMASEAAAMTATMATLEAFDCVQKRAGFGVETIDAQLCLRSGGEIGDAKRCSLSGVGRSGDGETKQQCGREDSGFHGLSPGVLRCVASVRKNMTCAAAHEKYRLAVCLIAVRYSVTRQDGATNAPRGVRKLALINSVQL